MQRFSNTIHKTIHNKRSLKTIHKKFNYCKQNKHKNTRIYYNIQKTKECSQQPNVLENI